MVCNVCSVLYEVLCAISQGRVFSPYLFAVYVDNVAEKVGDNSLGSRTKMIYLQWRIHRGEGGNRPSPRRLAKIVNRHNFWASIRTKINSGSPRTSIGEDTALP